MGSLENYLGAYIELEKKTGIIKDSIYTCSNSECDEHGRRKHSFENFCSYCSASVDNLEFDREYLIDLYELTGVEEDRFWIEDSEDTISLLPNFRQVKSVNTEVIGTLEVTKEIANDCINSFTDFYKSDIELIKQHYDNVVVRFGLVTCYF